ncbi:hypothetical protein ACOHWE_09540 [Cribrihabitans neustonicus]
MSEWLPNPTGPGAKQEFSPSHSVMAIMAQARTETIGRSGLGAPVQHRRSVSIWYAFHGDAPSGTVIAQYSDTCGRRVGA